MADCNEWWQKAFQNEVESESGINESGNLRISDFAEKNCLNLTTFRFKLRRIPSGGVLVVITVSGFCWYRDSAGNTVEENSSILSLIRML